MTIYYTSDTHFRHKAILRYDARPFSSLEEMEETIIRHWNARVRPTDTVYHLGDFVFGGGGHAREILGRLNGQKHLIWGNHDSNQVRKLTDWVSSQPYLEINDGNDLVCLHHYGQRVWNRCHYGAFHLFGHSHGSLPPQGRSIDVGMCCWNYGPVTLAEIKERLTELGLINQFGSHHGKQEEPNLKEFLLGSAGTAGDDDDASFEAALRKG
jgi:calcineurin-like phosphoesterase family protein